MVGREKSFMSETSKYRHLTSKYCYRADGQPGAGLDIASQGDPVVPWAWQLDLPPADFVRYSGGKVPTGIQLYGYGDKPLVVMDSSLDFVYSSHFIEDLSRERWVTLFRDWRQCLKPGGKLIILVPERTRWQAAIANGQCPNCSHYGPEPLLGDITKAANEAGGLKVIEERLTNLTTEDYTILGVMERI